MERPFHRCHKCGTRYNSERCPGCPKDPARAAKDRQRLRTDPRRKIEHNSRWENLRKSFFSVNPTCMAIDDVAGTGERRQCRSEAVVLHHLVDASVAPELAYDWDNLRAVCRFHHNPHPGAETEERLMEIDKYYVRPNKPRWFETGFGPAKPADATPTEPQPPTQDATDSPVTP
jgi:hypothetical protein